MVLPPSQLWHFETEQAPEQTPGAVHSKQSVTEHCTVPDSTLHTGSMAVDRYKDGTCFLQTRLLPREDPSSGQKTAAIWTKGYERQAKVLRDLVMLARMGVGLGSKGALIYAKWKEVPVEGVCVCVHARVCLNGRANSQGEYVQN